MDKCWCNMYSIDYWARERVIKSVRMILPYLRDGDIVVDLGCFTQFARNLFHKTILYRGLDSYSYHPSTEIVDLNSDSLALPKSNHYLCLETLEHVIHPTDVLRKIAESCSGYVVVSVPNEATLFHRIRCLLGTVDADCFQDKGKHLHLPSLSQTRKALTKYLDIIDQKSYICPTAYGCKQSWVSSFLRLIPLPIQNWLSCVWPSLFARGFIFLCKNKSSTTK